MMHITIQDFVDSIYMLGPINRGVFLSDYYLISGVRLAK